MTIEPFIEYLYSGPCFVMIHCGDLFILRPNHISFRSWQALSKMLIDKQACQRRVRLYYLPCDIATVYGAGCKIIFVDNISILWL